MGGRAGPGRAATLAASIQAPRVTVMAFVLTQYNPRGLCSDRHPGHLPEDLQTSSLCFFLQFHLEDANATDPLAVWEGAFRTMLLQSLDRDLAGVFAAVHTKDAP